MVPKAPESPAPEPRFRWAALFHGLTQPLFVLSARRRLLYANSSWENLFGVKLDEVRGRSCRRRAAVTGRTESVLGALAPPSSVSDGQPTQIRRRLPLPAGQAWAWLNFFPLAGAAGLRGILGAIRVQDQPQPISRQPWPEKIVALHDRASRRYALDHWQGNGPEAIRLRRQVRLAAQTRVPVSLIGPAGSGKQWLARSLHQETFGGNRYFAALDCGRLPGEAVADVLWRPLSRPLPLGTIYLHQPQLLPRDLQARLLEWFDQAEGADHPRLVAGFLADPHEAAPDLACRLGVLTIAVPALRERKHDLPWLVDALLARAAAAVEKSIASMSPEAHELVAAHAWPGNVAELYHVLRAACLRAKGHRLEAADFPWHLRKEPEGPPPALPLDALLEQVERKLLTLALRLSGNKRNRAAELLSIWRPRLLRRLEALKIQDS